MRATTAAPISVRPATRLRISISALLLVSCERADLRPVPNGVMIYQDGAARLDAIAARPACRAPK